MGKLIVIEGLDNVGKTTLINYYKEHFVKDMLKDKGVAVTVKFYQFPNDNTETGKVIRSYLDGHTQLTREALFYLFMANFYGDMNQLLEDIHVHDYVICDRFYYSNIAYSTLDFDSVVNMYDHHCTIKPDLVLFLDLSPEWIHEEREKHPKVDIHDISSEIQWHAYSRYHKMAKNTDLWDIWRVKGITAQTIYYCTIDAILYL